MISTILFWLFSILAIAGAIGLVFNRNPVYAALSLIINFFSIAALYLSLQAEFLAVIQIMVYAGAIMVLFLFVIMLLNLKNEEMELRFDARRGVALILGVAFIAEMAVIFRTFANPEQYQLAPDFTYGKVEAIGRALMTEYLFPFEMISVVLIAALVGAIIVARKHTYHS